VAAQVVEISKQEGAEWARPSHLGRPARLYRFPSRTTGLPHVPLEIAPTAQVAAEEAEAPQTHFRFRLAIELALGFAVWLTWFIWHQAH